ncbi:MAG: EFR1 family ferrodoxin [Bacteroidales bacterium]|nr:EFR1 family ferrodoxin [Bacteroidales bacterium]
MIICFSGTGNSRRIADILQDMLGDEVMRFAPGQMSEPERVRIDVTDGRVIWVFPIHAWGLPKQMVKVMRRIKIESRKPVSHFMVATCGDDIGYADRQWRRLVRQRGFHDAGAFSVQMPNTYTMMKGFDVDPEELAQHKLEAAEARAEDISVAIDHDKEVTDVVRGSWPWVKTSILYPLFQRFMCNPRRFHATEACVGCGKCSRNCPLANISMEDKQPKWGDNCTMCTRCYQCCPNHAVAYGKATEGKGQYLCPGYTLKN